MLLAPAILWMVLITYLSSRNELPDVQQLFKHADKVAHFGVYFVLGILLIIGVQSKTKQSNILNMFLVLIVGSVFGFIDEYHQSFVPNRVADIYDLIADISGILISLLFYKNVSMIFFNIIKKNKN